MRRTYYPSKRSGFTLVEMLVIAPLVVIVIGTIVGFLVSLVGNVLVSNTRSQGQYDVQDTLNQIEQDSYLATQYLSSYTPHSPQGKDGGTAQFTSSAGDIIFNQFGTTTNPMDPTRGVVYYANQPQPCNGQYQANRPFFIKVVYFLKTEADSSKSLYRRTLVPANNTGSNNADTTCAAPWQRSSCTTLNIADPRCQAKDTKLLTNVTAFTSTYYNKANPGLTITDPTIADSVRVSISVGKAIAGDTTTQTESVASSRNNSVAVSLTTPTAPVISILNPNSDTYNNPVLSTFQWSASAVNQYSYTYKIGSGAWSTPVVTTNTSAAVTTPNSYVTITFSVTATNEDGSTTSQYVYTTPLWTVPALQNGWVNYASTFPGSGYATFGYTKTSAGIIVLKGLINSSGTPPWDQVIATLAPGCRPTERNLYLSGGVGSADRFDIAPNGDILYEGGNTAFESLEGIAFIPAGSPYTWTTATLLNGWQPYVDINNWGTPGYTMDSIGRVFMKGLIKNGGTADGAAYMSMPVGYRPPDYLHIATDSNSAFDATGVEAGGNITTKGKALNTYRSLMLNYYSSGATTWTNLALQSNWQWYGGGFAYPQYTKGADGIVKLKGLIQLGTVASGTLVANLPVGYRPAAISLQNGDCNTIYCRFDVLPNGNIITRDNVSSVWSSLDTITFVAEQ